MNEILKKAISRQIEFKALSEPCQNFLIDYWELFFQDDGTKESNAYFAMRSDISIKAIERRFHELRTAKIIITDLNQYFEPNTARNKRGYVTLRRNYLDPAFKAKVKEDYNLIKILILDAQIKKDQGIKE